MAEIKWTDEQKLVIDTRNKNLLVSASAGSGKTTVMISRVIKLMIEQNIPISKFLIVTFTKASASDMKKKLVDELLKLEQTPFVLEQIENVSVSDISDLHSFYSKLISTYFYELDIDPKLKIIDDIDSVLLKERAISELFESKQKDGNKEFFEIFDFFQKKRNDTALKSIIYQFDNFLNATINAEKWFFDKLEMAYNSNIDTNFVANAINNYVCVSIKEDITQAEEFANRCKDLGCDSFAEHFFEIALALKSVRVEKSFAVNSKNIYEINIPRTPTAVPNQLKFLREEAKVVKDEIKKNIENYQKNYVSPNPEVLNFGLNFGRRILLNLYNLVKEFNEKYANLKKELGVVDFNDLEKFTLKILENDTIVQAVKDKYEYIFVDEYQDINEVQEYIISKISRNNNRFMVGDVKQSIYGFRLCDPQIFLNKQKEYSNKTESLVVPLNCNFRSDKKILKFVDDVFSGVMTSKFGGVDYKKDSQFVAGENNLDKPKSVNLCFIDTTKQENEEYSLPDIYSVKNHLQTEIQEKQQAIAEANYVAMKVAELVDPRKSEHLEYKDIAVLVSSRNPFTEKFIDCLKSFGIPVSSDEKFDLLTKNYVQEILNFVKFVVNEKDDILLFKVLKSKLFNFKDNELVEIRKINFKERFCDIIYDYGGVKNPLLKKKLDEFFEKVNKFKSLLNVLNLKDFVRKIIEDFSLYQINLLSENGEIINEEIDLFVSKLPDKSVVNYVLNYENSELEYQSECSGDTVKVMTIHKSKGLEFKAVFLVNTANEFNMMSIFGSVLFHKDFGVGINAFDYNSRAEIPTIPMSAVQIFSKRKLVEEQQRVLYVALTRAIEKLFVLCSKPIDALKLEFPKRPKAFIDWFEPMIKKGLNGSLDSNINFESFSSQDLFFVQRKEPLQLLLKKQDGIVAKPFEYNYKESVGVLLKNSVSKILHKNKNNYSLNSEADNFETIRQSEEFASSADRGTIYHKVFELIDLKNLDNIDNQLSTIINEKFSESEQKIIDKNLVERVLSNDIFVQISDDDRVFKEREFYAEMPIKLINLDTNSDDTFILQGVIDLVIVKKNGIILLDYKTGKITQEKLENYAFQLNTYAMVAERAFKQKVINKYLLFVDEEKLIEI